MSEPDPPYDWTVSGFECNRCCATYETWPETGCPRCPMLSDAEAEALERLCVEEEKRREAKGLTPEQVARFTFRSPDWRADA